MGGVCNNSYTLDISAAADKAMKKHTAERARREHQPQPAPQPQPAEVEAEASPYGQEYRFTLGGAAATAMGDPGDTEYIRAS